MTVCEKGYLLLNEHFDGWWMEQYTYMTQFSLFSFWVNLSVPITLCVNSNNKPQFQNVPSSLKNIPLLSRISCVLIVWHVCYVTPQVSCPPAQVTDCRGFLDPLLSGDISCWYWLMTGHTGWHRHSYILIMSWSIWLYNIVFKNLTTKIYTFPVSIINYTR